ncbi:MAG: hypothetical protein IPP58_13615 [Holophagaceae bacterium]|uniref:Uncharacterized protein n=1 Tax=Candidatus Geothrix skivensis TaxID=2954439 RepID=A0A9D7XIQ1_9BACT|nr:hypothetical protein [Candidatus Geothrix skivensis]
MKAEKCFSCGNSFTPESAQSTLCDSCREAAKKRASNPVVMSSEPPQNEKPVANMVPPISTGGTSASQSKFQGFRTYNVGGFIYLMSYFEAIFSGEGTPMGVADQFTKFVASYAAQGFEFFRCDEVPYKVVPGCLSGLFGAKTSFGNCTIVTFR